MPRTPASPVAPRPPHPGKTRAEADRSAAYHHLAQTLRGLEDDLRWGLEDSPRIPAAWAEIAQGPVVPEKALTTIRIDKDVVAFFRAMGPGHLARMNAVLRTFMLARLAGVVTGPEGVEYGPTPVERYMMEAADLVMALQRRNEVAADGGKTGALDLRIERRMAALEDLAEAAGVPVEERLRM
ncbi:MAG: BrnA antitoxin family protein [Paracoccaceae bacterium]